jgi:hypothetical protein
MIWLELGGREAKPFPHFPAKRLGAWLRAGFFGFGKAGGSRLFSFPQTASWAATCTKRREQNQDVTHACNTIVISIYAASRYAPELGKEQQQIRCTDQPIVVEIARTIGTALHRAAAGIDCARPVANTARIECSDAGVLIVADVVVVRIRGTGPAADV